MNCLARIALIALILLLSTPLLAENIEGANRFICAVVIQEICPSDEPCTDGGPAWDTGIPEFVEFDVKNETMGTTKASGAGRSSKVSVHRDHGLIIMRTYELGKAFTIVINESTGIASASVTADGEVISIFAVCTPR